MVGKDKTSKAGKGKKALAAEWAQAVAAADAGDPLIASSSHTPKGGERAVSSNYIPPKKQAPPTVAEEDLPKTKGKR